MCAAPAETVVDRADGWVRGQTFAELFKKQEVKNLLQEIAEDSDYWMNQRKSFDQVVDLVEQYLRQEDRSLKSLLRDGLTNNILEKVETLDVSPDVVKAFMRTPAVESMAGAILYTGIFEFVQRADILGNVVNNLPVIGPIRQEINKALKQTLDQTLGTQVKDFLGTQSRPAVEQMIQFVLSKDNKAGFGLSGRRLADYVLSRPVSSLLPSEESAKDLREDLWKASRQVVGSVADQSEILDDVFAKIGDRKVGELVPKFPESAKRGMLALWRTFLDSEDGVGLGLSAGKPAGRARERDLE